MSNLLVVLALLCAISAAQVVERGSITAEVVGYDRASDHATLRFSYRMPADVTPSPNFPSQAPTTILWHWGENKEYAELPYSAGQIVTHAYTGVGERTVMVTVIDARNRMIHQTSVTVKIHKPIEVTP